ncbi:hypothetical protein J7E70_16320 [Variovorax paradoxus]|nr:hypothetical protein [Variovorax paradoxus]MBT2302030.1 hypothetical protein [Variovorax paradoxus]
MPDAASAEQELPLFSGFRIAEVDLKNRLVPSAQDGMADDFHLAHIAKFAMGGFGLVFTEAAAMTPGGRHAPMCIDYIERFYNPTRRHSTLAAPAGVQSE